MKCLSRAIVLLSAFFVLVSGPAHARLYLPKEITFLAEETKSLCGLRADYILSGSVLRVELLVSTGAPNVAVVSRVYQPNSSGPLMRDIWLRTDALLTVGLFKPAVENSNGILELNGVLEGDKGKLFLRDFTRGDVEISIIFDGVMPTARFPVGLPMPLPADVRSELQGCLNEGQ